MSGPAHRKRDEPREARAEARASLAPLTLFVLFTVFLVQLPFELPGSLAPIEGLVVTHLEVTLLLLLLAYAAWRLRGSPPERPPSPVLHRPETWIAVWIAALAVATALAPALHAVSIKFLLRSAAIAGLFWVSRDLHAALSDRMRTMRILSALGGIVALLGILEGARGGLVEPLLAYFRPMPTFVSGTWRLTSTFSHANQAASWLAMCLPLAAWLALRSRRPLSLWTAVLAVDLWALLETQSRGGVAAGLLVLIGLLLVYLLYTKNKRRTVLLLGLVLALPVLRFATGPAARERFGFPPGKPPYAAAYDCPARLSMEAGEEREVPVRVTNEGYASWESGGPFPVRLSYHLYDLDRPDDPPGEGVRGLLPGAVPSGGAQEVLSPLVAPEEPGLYLVAWDLVREKVLWFTSHDVKPGLTMLLVRPRGAPPAVGGTDPRFDEWTNGMPPAERLAWLDRLAKSGGEGRAEGAGIERTPAPPEPPAAPPPADVLPPAAVPPPPAAEAPGAAPARWYADPTAVPRSVLWRTALGLFRERPLIGWGPDVFRYIYHRRLGLPEGDTRLQSHNLYLELSVSGGILVLAGWLFFLGSLGAIGLRLRPGIRLETSLPTLLPWVGVIGVFAVHALVESFLGSYEVMGFFWIAAGALVAAARS